MPGKLTQKTAAYAGFVYVFLMGLFQTETFGQSLEAVDSKGTIRFINWSLNGSDIHNNNVGNVGIGTINPLNTLEVSQGTAGNSGLRLTDLPSASLLATDANGDVISNNPATGTIGTSSYLGFDGAGNLVLGPSLTSDSFWNRTGNANITATDFLGTTNDVKLSLQSNSVPILELGRRETLGLLDNSATGLSPYNQANASVAYVRGSGGVSALEFEASAAAFYKPIFFTDADGNFLMRGSSAGTDFFEVGSAGSANNGQLIFTVGDDGNEPMVFQKYNYNTQTNIEMLRLQGTGLNNNVRAGINVNGATPNSTLQVNGSASYAIINTTRNLILDESHHSVILGGNHTITLPAANTCTGRMYFIKNPSTNATAISAYLNLSGAITSLVSEHSSLVVQSDGTNWQQIVVDNKATMTDNGNGTFTFSNATGTADDVILATQTPNTNTVISSALWLDTTAIPITTTDYSQSKSFVVPGGTLGTQNAIKITGYRRRGSSNQQIRLLYGGQTFFTSGGLGNTSARFEIIVFADGSTTNQKAFLDDANTGGNGQRFGTVTVDSTVDQTIEIQIRATGSVATPGFIDFCTAEILTIGN